MLWRWPPPHPWSHSLPPPHGVNQSDAFPRTETPGMYLAMYYRPLNKEENQKPSNQAGMSQLLLADSSKGTVQPILIFIVYIILLYIFKELKQMEETTFLPQLILKLGNSLSSSECQKLRWIKKAIGQNKKSLFLPSNTADRREQGFTSPTIRWGKRQSKEELTSHQTTSIRIPGLVSTGIWRDRHSVYTTQVYSVPLYLLNSWPMDFPSWRSPCAATEMWQHTQGVLLLVTKFVSMALNHRFADIMVLENPSKPPDSFWE